MGSISGTCEIVESKEELNLVRQFRGNRKTESTLRMNERDHNLPMLKVGRSKYLEDDLNQLFKAINIKASSKSLDLSDLASTSSLRKNVLKKPSGLGVSYSPRSEITETVTLKKALRGLSISHASEVAAMKRLSKSSYSPGVSEAGRITSLYRSVVVESNESSPSFHKGKGSMVEMSLPEESSSNFSKKSPQYLQDARIKSSNQNTRSSPRLTGAVTPKVKGTTLIQKEITPPSTEVGKETLKAGLTEKEKHASLPSLSSPKSGENKLSKDVSASKFAVKVSITKPGRKGRLQTVSSSSSNNGNRLNKITRNNHRLVKPVLKNRNLVKKKSKQESTSATCTSDIYNEVNGDIDPSKSQMVCQRCQCTMKNARTESNQGSSVSHNPEIVAEVSLNDLNTGASRPTSIGDSCNRSGAEAKANKNTKSKDKGEFSQSSKSSLGEYSTSTSASEESNLSGSSCGNRPHMSKDVRWEAIRHVRTQHGNLGLSHFNLLKKLGCGDIGTVYLAELIGANCLFAIKVMDNEYLARRKKMPRAQTEREILRMLDHPFLPTLYSQFTSDNLSCLVMEYCPGGDLHVLRQKQSGRNFPEQAAR